MPVASSRGPLAGVRVIDLAGPPAALAGRTLSELGAEVLAIEGPEGDAARRRGPFDHRDDTSLYWATVGMGKRSLILDLSAAADRNRLRQLVDVADVFIESWSAAEAETMGDMSAGALAHACPRLIHATVTAYGRSGPKSAWPGTELTAEAASGRLFNQGDRDRPPVPIGYPQAYFHAGVQAAADIVIALNQRDRSGRGQHLDISIQSVMVHTLFGSVSGTMLNDAPPADPAAAARRAARNDLLPEIWECADGHVAAPLAAGALPLAEYIAGRVGAEGQLDARLKDLNWSRLAADVLRSRLDDDVVRAAIDMLARWFRARTKAELYRLAFDGDFRLGPLMTTRDLLEDDHLADRGYWVDIGGRTHPGAAVRPDLFAAVPDPAPALGADGGLPARWLAAPPAGGDQCGRDDQLGAEASEGDDQLGAEAFAGLKVADFSWVAVGPTMGRALADHGATVVRVESAHRLDVARQLAPFKGEAKGINDSHWYAHFNASKLGMALNLGTDEGRQVARRLVDWADVVIESFSPGTMARLGLDYATVSAEHPDLIMISASLLGQTGPMAQFAGFGQQGVGLCGISTITGWPDRMPVPPLGAYTDVVAPKYGIAALAAEIYQRRRTGAGAYLDLGQVEASIRFIEPLVLDDSVNGHTPGRRGLTSEAYCPHGVYPVLGRRRFVAIAVETGAQWRALHEVLGLDDLASADLDSLAARQEIRAAIDEAVARRTAACDGEDLVERLVDAGVPAAEVSPPAEAALDPQLAHRRQFVWLDHAAMGSCPYEAPATKFSAKSVTVHAPAPVLGQHTTRVLSELLGFSDDEIAALAAAGALE